MSIITGGLGEGSKIVTQGYGECRIVLTPSGGGAIYRPRYFRPIFKKPIKIPVKKDKKLKKLLEYLKMLDVLGLTDYLDDIENLSYEELQFLNSELDKGDRTIRQILLEIYEKRLKKEKDMGAEKRDKLIEWLMKQKEK